MTLRKVRVPFGVVGMICEARPNVTADIFFALCVKTGNACVLKGGSDARRSNEAIAALLHGARSRRHRPGGLHPAARGPRSRGGAAERRGLRRRSDPARRAGLIRFVRENARIPVIETGRGIVPYFDLDGDLERPRRGLATPRRAA